MLCGNRTARELGEVLLPISTFLLILPCVEQPQGSVLWEWDSIKRFFASLPIVYEAKLKMGWFGGKSEKPLDFRGCWQGLQVLQRINDESGRLLKESGALNDVERVKLATKGKRRDFLIKNGY